RVSPGFSLVFSSTAPVASYVLRCLIYILFIIRPPPTSTLFPYTTLFRSITFREREFGESKMSGDIVAEAFTNVTKLGIAARAQRSEEHTSELQSRFELVCRLLLCK